MLKGINPMITPDLLHILAGMGHGDRLAIVDSNYPALASGRPVVRYPSTTAPEILDAILELMPLDTFETPLYRMEIVGEESRVPEVATEGIAIANRHENRTLPVGALSRDEFYKVARDCAAVVATGEARPYGCFVLVKGTWPQITPSGK